MKKILTYLPLAILLSGCALFGGLDDSSSTAEGDSSSSSSRVAQSNLRNAYTNAKGIYVDSQDWGTVTIAGLSAAEPLLTFTADASTASDEISVKSTTTGGIVLAAKSDDGSCYDLAEPAEGGAKYGVGSCDASSVGSVQFDELPTRGGW